MAALKEELGIDVGETTTDGNVSLMAARCLGACGIAPAIVIDGTVSGKETLETTLDKVKALQQH